MKAKRTHLELLLSAHSLLISLFLFACSSVDNSTSGDKDFTQPRNNTLASEHFLVSPISGEDRSACVNYFQNIPRWEKVYGIMGRNGFGGEDYNIHSRFDFYDVSGEWSNFVYGPAKLDYINGTVSPKNKTAKTPDQTSWHIFPLNKDFEWTGYLYSSYEAPSENNNHTGKYFEWDQSNWASNEVPTLSRTYDYSANARKTKNVTTTTSSEFGVPYKAAINYFDPKGDGIPLEKDRACYICQISTYQDGIAFQKNPDGGWNVIIEPQYFQIQNNSIFQSHTGSVTFSGTLVDPHGVVPNFKISIQHDLSAQFYVVYTDQNGNYSFTLNNTLEGTNWNDENIYLYFPYADISQVQNLELPGCNYSKPKDETDQGQQSPSPNGPTRENPEGTPTDPVNQAIDQCLTAMGQPQCDPTWPTFSSYASSCMCQSSFAECLSQALPADMFNDDPMNMSWCHPCNVEFADVLFQYTNAIYASGGTPDPWGASQQYAEQLAAYQQCLDNHSGGNTSGGGGSTPPPSTGAPFNNDATWWTLIMSYFYPSFDYSDNDEETVIDIPWNIPCQCTLPSGKKLSVGEQCWIMGTSGVACTNGNTSGGSACIPKLLNIYVDGNSTNEC